VSRVQVHVLHTVDEIAALGAEWDALSARFGMPLLDHDWFLSAAEALHDERDIRVVTVREAGTLTAVAPMAINQSDRHLVILGTATLFEPSGWIFSSESALQHLASAVVDLGEVTVLDRVPTSLPTCRLLPRMVRGTAVTITRETAPSHAVRTDRSWSSLSTAWSSATRRRLEAARDRARQIDGDVRLEILNPSASDVDEAFSLLVNVEAAGWKGRMGSALAVRPDLSRFFRTYARRAAERRQLRVGVLWIGAVPAAVELAVAAHGRLWGLKIAYDEQYSRCSPALQVVHASIKSASEQGLAAYEFLGSAEPWQKRWKPEARNYRLAALYPLSRRAAVTALYDLAAFVSRRIQKPPTFALVTTS
jgi:CelD/BcsL family acetyltransferase involved in cellulose biosynthesis